MPLQIHTSKLIEIDGPDEVEEGLQAEGVAFLARNLLIANGCTARAICVLLDRDAGVS